MEYLWSIVGILRKKCPHRGWLSIKVITQLKTSENSWEHRKTSKIIWYHPENNWGPIIYNLVQFEEDFNSRTEMWWGQVGVDRLSQTRPIPRSPDGDKNLFYWLEKVGRRDFLLCRGLAAVWHNHHVIFARPLFRTRLLYDILVL